MDKLIVTYTRTGTRVNVEVIADGVKGGDSSNFVDVAHAEGYMTDEFHHATSDRYKQPSAPLVLRRLRQLDQLDA